MDTKYYHVVNSGVDGRLVFNDKKDIDRFLSLLSYYKNDNPKTRFSFRKRISDDIGEKKEPNSLVEIVCFCLMPNHFHLLVKESQEKGLGKFLSKVSNSYTKYFNSRNKREGTLFKGKFKAVLIENERDLVDMSRYVHRNPLSEKLVYDLKKFPFSSYLEYVSEASLFASQKVSGASGFCQKDLVLKSFSSQNEYEKFVLDHEDYYQTLPKIQKLIIEQPVKS